LSPISRLTEFPDLGPPRPRLGRGVRIRIVAPSVAIYEHKNDTVTVLRVLHGRRFQIDPRLT
jgi:plasmid stabilization system protein ParE